MVSTIAYPYKGDKGHPISAKILMDLLDHPMDCVLLIPKNTLMGWCYAQSDHEILGVYGVAFRAHGVRLTPLGGAPATRLSASVVLSCSGALFPGGGPRLVAPSSRQCRPGARRLASSNAMGGAGALPDQKGPRPPDSPETLGRACWRKPSGGVRDSVCVSPSDSAVLRFYAPLHYATGDRLPRRGDGL